MLARKLLRVSGIVLFLHVVWLRASSLFEEFDTSLRIHHYNDSRESLTELPASLQNDIKATEELIPQKRNHTSNANNILNRNVLNGTEPTILHTYDLLIVQVGAPGQAISCEAVGNPRPIIRWTFDEQNLTDNNIVELRKDNTSYLIFPAMKESHSGNYTCTAENDFGQATSNLQLIVTNDEGLTPLCTNSNEPDNYQNPEIEGKTMEHQNRTKRSIWYRWIRSDSSANKDLQKLLNLIAQRLLLADKVAISKWDTNTAIEDAPREAVILQNVVKQAQNTGLDPNWARLFFRDQIEANKDVQNGLFLKWRKQGERPMGDTVDLQKEVRPMIDFINEELMSLSQKTKKARMSWFCRSKVERDARYTTFIYGLDFLHQRALQRAVSHLCV